MKIIYKTKVSDIIPSTIDEGKGQIIDGYAKFKINNIIFWAFVSEDWRMGNWSLSNKGKTVSVSFSFVCTNLEKWHKKEKKITPQTKRKKPCDYILTGKIIGKSPFESIHEENRKKFEMIDVDCGFVVRMTAKKGGFGIGDFIGAEGRLDARKESGDKK